MFTVFKDELEAKKIAQSFLSRAKIITKYSLERFLSICGEKLSKGFLKFCKTKTNSRQENHSKLSFTARIITKCFLECFLSICGEKMSKGFLKFCKLISNLILSQIIVSNLYTDEHKLAS